MAHTVIHISEAEAENDFRSVLARLREGAEIVIDGNGGGSPVAVVRPAMPERRTISESIALAEAHAKELGYEPRMDPEFAADLEEIIRNPFAARSLAMGLILDSSVLIADERRNQSVQEMLLQLRSRQGETT
jgi:antitoxin (DNA-binding transcriptional repressor) of toxin-antitoxin stability system